MPMPEADPTWNLRWPAEILSPLLCRLDDDKCNYCADEKKKEADKGSRRRPDTPGQIGNVLDRQKSAGAERQTRH